MTKILFIILDLKCGGAERSLINLLTVLPPERYDVSLLLFRKAGDFLPLVPAHVHILDTPESLARLYGPLGRCKRLLPTKLIGTLAGRLLDGRASEGRMMVRWKRFYRKAIEGLPGHYDVAVAYLEGESAYYLCDHVEASRRIAWIHNDYDKLGLRAEDEIEYFRRMDALVTVSDTCRDALAAAFPGLRERIHVLGNITSAQAVRRQADGPMPEEVREGKFTILSVGRLQEQKGFDMAIDAAALLKEKGVDFEWLILGQGELRGELEERIARRGVRERVRLLGVRGNPYVYMKHADLLVQPSRFEGKSIAVDEAKMIGLPVLLTRYSTARDQVDDGKDGFLADMDAASIAGGIERLIRDPARLRAVRDYQLAHDYDNVAELADYEALFDGLK